MKNSGDCLMSHSLTFTLSFMCGETDAIVITRSSQTEMGCKRTPLNCELSQWDVQKSFTMLLVSVTSAALRSQKSIHQNSPLKRWANWLINYRSGHGAILLSLQLLWSIRYGSVLKPGQKKRDMLYSTKQLLLLKVYIAINSLVHTWACNSYT